MTAVSTSATTAVTVGFKPKLLVYYSVASLSDKTYKHKQMTYFDELSTTQYLGNGSFVAIGGNNPYGIMSIDTNGFTVKKNSTGTNYGTYIVWFAITY